MMLVEEYLKSSVIRTANLAAMNFVKLPQVTNVVMYLLNRKIFRSQANTNRFVPKFQRLKRLEESLNRSCYTVYLRMTTSFVVNRCVKTLSLA